jgi:phosphopantothenoylcysteine synthetase/decarboxylase
VQENVAKLRKLGVKFIEPKEGKLACGDVGKGALADVDEIVKAAVALLK